jgi:hypothetical protein
MRGALVVNARVDERTDTRRASTDRDMAAGKRLRE